MSDVPPAERAAPNEVAFANIDGRMVAYRPGEVIAIGRQARTFLTDNYVEPETLVDPETAESLGVPFASRLRGLDDSLAVVARARAEGHQIELNHVLFSHHRCCCDGSHPAGPLVADPFKANSIPQAQPFKANTPYDTTATKSAKPSDLEEDAAEGDAGVAATIWVLDTGLGDDSDDRYWLKTRGPIDGDPVDSLDQIPGDQGDGRVDPVAGHGTFIAGIIKQLVPSCTVRAPKVIEPDGDVEEAAVFSQLNQLLQQDDPTKTILNLSFGGALYDASTALLAEQIAALQAKGVVVVASAGNEASCAATYPAAFPEVISVGALDATGTPASFTNYGPWVRACAKGVDIVSTFLIDDGKDADSRPSDSNLADFTSGWATWSGTSFAAPIVAAAIAKEITTANDTANGAWQKVVQSALGRSDLVRGLGVRIDGDGFSDQL